MITEIKYIHLLSPRLPKFKRKKEFLWNCRCVICGDSKRSKNKARGFIFRHKDDFLYKCHNCGVSMSLSKLIETLDPQMYKEYRMEKFKENNPSQINEEKFRKIVSSPPKFQKDILSSLVKIDSLNNSHPAKEYLLNRKLPTESLYYTEKYKEYTNSVRPNTFEGTFTDEPRIIIPLINSEGITFGYQARAIGQSFIRYITIIIDESQPKIFGLNKVNFQKPIYVTEGPFDSLLLDNSIAMAGSDIPLDFLCNDSVCVMVYDNEHYNRAITNRMSSWIESERPIVIWPSSIKEKDINEMHLAGYDVNKLVRENTYSGLEARLKFNLWRK